MTPGSLLKHLGISANRFATGLHLHKHCAEILELISAPSRHLGNQPA
jgi:hypothetical protein